MKNIQFGIQYYFKDILFSVIKSLIVSYQSSVVTTEVRFWILFKIKSVNK